MSRLGSLVIGCALTCFGPSIADAATFTITYNGAPPEAQTAVQHAADIWADILVSPVPIKMLVNWFPLGTSTLGITFPNGRRDFAGAPLGSTWYATSLANSMTGAELNAGENDFEIWLNSSTNWYYDSTGTPGAGQYDLESIALHEICHGLGFVGLCKKTGSDGSFGLLQMTDFSPLFTTFPWPQLDTLPSVFDRHLVNSNGDPLSALANPSAALGTALCNNHVYFGGPLTDVATAGAHARIYAPGAFALGSSDVHLNEGSYPANTANELMTPFSGAGDLNHWPGPICLAILQDIGWQFSPDVGIAERRTQEIMLRCFPNPATTSIEIIAKDHDPAMITISDATGRTALTTMRAASIDVSMLKPGSYTITRNTNGSRSFARLVKQ